MGVGKVISISSMAERLQGATGLEIIHGFSGNLQSGEISIAPQAHRSSRTNLFPCTETGCYISFPISQEAEAHMDSGKHVMQLEQETEYVRVRKKLGKKGLWNL